MKVTCIDTTNKNLSEKALSQGYIIKEEFERLELNKTYQVYGISIWGDVLYYLITDEYEDCPIWYPADLFCISDSSLPSEWYFNRYNPEQNNGLSAVWGYREIALDINNHNDNLMEREHEDIEIFLSRKKQIEMENK